MATTITPATLTVTLEETISLNGVNYGDSRVHTIANITEVTNRLINVDTSAHRTLLTFAAAPSSGGHVLADVKYIRITNLDNANYVELIIKLPQISDEAGLGGTVEPSAMVKLEAGKSFTLGTPNSGFGALSFSSTIAAANLAVLEYISAKANTAAVDLQVFVAST